MKEKSENRVTKLLELSTTVSGAWKVRGKEGWEGGFGGNVVGGGGGGGGRKFENCLNFSDPPGHISLLDG